MIVMYLNYEVELGGLIIISRETAAGSGKRQQGQNYATGVHGASG